MPHVYAGHRVTAHERGVGVTDGQDAQRGGLSWTALAVQDLARLLTRAGGKTVSVEMLNADITAGAPVNPDGTMNLVQYAAWLVREVESGD